MSYRLQKSCYLNRVDHDKEIMSTKKRTGIGKYSFANRATELWQQVPAHTSGNISCKPSNFGKRG
jgi:hypothetical protein